MGQVRNCPLHKRYSSNSKKTKVEECKELTDNLPFSANHSWSWKNQTWKLQFCLFSFFLFSSSSSSSSHLTWNYMVYANVLPSYQMTALLLEMFLSWFGASCERWLVSYGPKCTTQSPNRNMVLLGCSSGFPCLHCFVTTISYVNLYGFAYVYYYTYYLTSCHKFAGS